VFIRNFSSTNQITKQLYDFEPTLLVYEQLSELQYVSQLLPFLDTRILEVSYNRIQNRSPNQQGFISQTFLCIVWLTNVCDGSYN